MSCKNTVIFHNEHWSPPETLIPQGFLSFCTALSSDSPWPAPDRMCKTPQTALYLVYGL